MTHSKTKPSLMTLSVMTQSILILILTKLRVKVVNKLNVVLLNDVAPSEAAS
jgi:hypothetical protein